MDENRFNESGLSGSQGSPGIGEVKTGGIGTTGTSTDAGNDGIRPFTAVGGDSEAETTGGLSAGIVSLLEKLGVNEAQVSSVRDTLKTANVDQALDKAREQVNEAVGKARTYAKQNPGAVLAGIAVLVVGAGLIAGAALRRNSENL